jgi:PPK2 family polyphosphate:nucleotide phosphotransferase
MNVTVDSFRVPTGSRDPLGLHEPADTRPFRSKPRAETYLEQQLQRLRDLQERLYADGRYALLLVLQGMDASGKDSLIGHVMRGVNPQGIRVVPFKVPSDEDVAHDFLWRASKALPRKGEIAVFNRSYYEDVLVVRVHPDLLDRQKLPRAHPGRRLWNERFEDIRAFERHLERGGTVVRKVYLHLSEREQRERLLARLTDPTKNWKFEAKDLAERACWADYMHAYGEALSATSTRHAPWYAVPADRKWFARAVVARMLVDTLESLDLRYPRLPPRDRDAVERAIAELGDQRAKAAPRR